ncbi:U11/U12 small nuclear ribonucleoprotein 31 kDa protein [Lathyrus oleraceus]|uniref:U11/U12 small nuclear ribonucleoprotein 31 kDa protein n=1 Tax=Pisum sativum TaxID=3888 RepID=UPI0021D1E3CB|nr:U11/U12 small nuclear ribonucleoprotein 31 kDa protein-like [Pisum sativum]
MSSKKKHKRKHSDSDEDDDLFYYRYCASSSTPNTTTGTTSSNQPQSKPNNKGSSIGGTGEPLAPSKSTLYVSNLDYSLTNSDLHTLFSTFGRIARVTVLKDRHTRLSRGVAFVQFVSRNDAQRAVAEMNKKILNGRTLTASIAADNGRAPEFIRKRVYNTETASCYECVGHGHLSYECPKNQLGPRPRPQPKKPRRGFSGLRDRDGEEEGDEEEEEGGQIAAEQFNDNWASVVDDEAGERLLGETEMMMRVWTTTRRRRKGRKLGISVMRVIMMMMIDHDYVALTLQIEGVCLVFRITALFN